MKLESMMVNLKDRLINIEKKCKGKYDNEICNKILFNSTMLFVLLMFNIFATIFYFFSAEMVIFIIFAFLFVLVRETGHFVNELSKKWMI